MQGLIGVVEWASSFLAFLALLCCAIPYGFYFYGARIRKFSKFAFHDEDEDVKNKEGDVEKK
jgi:hypothetical protein